MKKKQIDHLNWEADNAVARIKAEISPKTPCVHSDADGRCSTGNCQGSICCGCADYKPQTAVATTHADLPAIALEQAQGATAAECVKFDLGMANRHGALSLAYLARAGWRLSHQKAEIGRGGWKSWCRETVGISEDTANRYIHFYNKTVTRWRESQGLANAMVAELTDKMIAAATADIDAQTATGAMIELGIVKRPAGWGGAREGAGRTPGVLPKLTATQEAETLWAQVMGVLDKTTVKDAIRFLREKAAEACLDRVAELAEALKLQVRELRGVR